VKLRFESVPWTAPVTSPVAFVSVAVTPVAVGGAAAAAAGMAVAAATHRHETAATNAAMVRRIFMLM
jgi:hypothetical protein